MSNHTNHRRGEKRRTEHGPSWESHTPSKGCNSTHVAKTRARWKKIKNRSFRRNGKVCPKFHWMVYGKTNLVTFEDDLEY